MEGMRLNKTLPNLSKKSMLTFTGGGKVKKAGFVPFDLRMFEVYVRDHSEAEFAHGICPECFKKLYPDEPLEDL